MTTNWNKTFTCHARVVLTHYLEQFQRDFWAHVFMTHPVSGPFVLQPCTLLQMCWTVEPPLTPTSLQRPLFGRQSIHWLSFKPLYNGHLSMTATFFCPQGGRCEGVLRSTIMVLFQLIGVFAIYVCWKFDLKQYFCFSFLGKDLNLMWKKLDEKIFF